MVHFCTHLAWRRPAYIDNGYQDNGLSCFACFVQILYPVRHSTGPSKACRTASGVAGAFSTGMGFESVAMASRMAWKTDKASINGGSPTAFDR